MNKAYQSQEHEAKIYKLWEEKGFFRPRPGTVLKPFVVTLPPPNVTGGLHAGHAMYVVEDILVRYHRMKGENTLFLPGFDHASIAVEYLVKKQLAKEGKNKKEIGREEFLKRAECFAEDSKKYIREQLKKLGFSLDWSREAYTMDKVRSMAVKEAFKKLYNQGLIYQGERIVHWCIKCQTTLSDLEVDYKERKNPLYYLKYGPFILATTRPETKFGDVAVAVHPKDKRYQKWIGKEFVYQSLIGPRKIKVVADKIVDPEFGTGVVKVTPAHDFNDFEISKRHKLKTITVINRYGRLNKNNGRFRDLTVNQARKKIVEELKKKGDLIKVDKSYLHRIGTCYRCGRVIEPIISKQWFIKMKPLAKKAIAAVKKGHIKIIPKRFEKVYFHWLENIRDWCISRQLWWGHKIPLKGEDDILDTWFSASLWPISVFGWPKKTEDFQCFYPTTIRETGYDILFFWVAKEIMMCLAMTDQVPFKTVYLHGLVRDEKGRKFSKTTGVGFDPTEMMEKYGTDALRIALVIGNAPGHDLKIEENKIKAYRNFANKIWNASRFVISSADHLRGGVAPAAHLGDEFNKEDKEMIKEINSLIISVTKHLDKFRFDLAAEKIYQCFWHQFCDRYLEAVKKRQDDPAAQWTLMVSLKTFLKLLHPFMPFITEVIWQKIKDKKDSDLIISPWPKKISF